MIVIRLDPDGECHWLYPHSVYCADCRQRPDAICVLNTHRIVRVKRVMGAQAAALLRLVEQTKAPETFHGKVQTDFEEKLAQIAEQNAVHPPVKHGPVVHVEPNHGAAECPWCRWSRRSRVPVDWTVPLCAVHKRAARRVARSMLRRLGM